MDIHVATVSASEEYSLNDDRIFVVLIPSFSEFTYIYVQCRARVCLRVKGWAHPVESGGKRRVPWAGEVTLVLPGPLCRYAENAAGNWVRARPGRAGQGWLPPPAPADIPGESLTSFCILILGDCSPHHARCR